MSYLCPPAILYIVLSIISIIFIVITCTFPLIYHLINILVIILWTWLLNYICLSGHIFISWILVLLPIFFIILCVIYGLIALKKMTPEQIDKVFKELDNT